MTTYKVQIRSSKGYETIYTTQRKRQADRRARDAAAAGFDGRIITAKGHVANEWELVQAR